MTTPAVSRTDKTSTIAWPVATSSLHKHRAVVEARPEGESFYLSVQEIGPRGGSVFASATVSPSGADELRAQLRPRVIPEQRLMFARADKVTDKADDTVARLATIQQAVELLRDVPTTGDRPEKDRIKALAAIQPLIAEVSELLATALTHAAPELAEEV